MSQRDSPHEADRDARDVALKGKVARRERWSKRRRSVSRELMVYSRALNTVRKDNSLRSQLYGPRASAGLLDRICDGILLLRYRGRRKWILPVR